MDSFFELHLDKRIAKAKARAERIASNKHTDFDDGIFYLRAILSKHYNLPIFHEYFIDRTLDELIFEIELINAFDKPSGERGQEILKENKEEAEGLFDDWAEDDMVEVSKDDAMSEEEFNKISQQFMTSGDFQE